MSFMSTMNIGASALTAQRIRMDIIAQNVAMQDVVRPAGVQAYRRRMVVMEPLEEYASFSEIFSRAKDGFIGQGVRVSNVVLDGSPLKVVYDPSHPYADEDGNIYLPNVDTVKEMADMISATRSYESNVTVLSAVKGMAIKALEIGR